MSESITHEAEIVTKNMGILIVGILLWIFLQIWVNSLKGVILAQENKNVIILITIFLLVAI